LHKIEKAEINKKKRAKETMRKKFEAKNSQRGSSLTLKTVPFNPTEFIKNEVFEKIDYNESHGFEPRRSVSRIKRLQRELI
jgi:hypothetical protein